MRVRQSDLKTWQRCPLAWRFQHIDKMRREQSGALSFGTIIHAAVLLLEETRDLHAAITAFKGWWADPESLEPGLTPDYYVKATSWEKYAEEGVRILERWWELIQWEADVVIAREHHFIVPIGNDGNELEGTADKVAVRYLADVDRYAVLISDYKTSRKEPTYGYLAHDLQFSAYCYATTRPEFWEGLPNGQQMYEQYADAPRVGEWVQLLGPRRKSAGERTEMHYNRLAYAVDQMVRSVDMRIFVPTISGDTCAYCDYRTPCGIDPDMESEAERMRV